MIVVSTSNGLLVDFKYIVTGELYYGLVYYDHGFIAASRMKRGTRFSFFHGTEKYKEILTDKIEDVHGIDYWGGRIWATDTFNKRVATVDVNTGEVGDSLFGEIEHPNSILVDNGRFYVLCHSGVFREVGGKEILLSRGSHTIKKREKKQFICSSDEGYIYEIEGMQVKDKRFVTKDYHIRGLNFNPDIIGCSRRASRGERHGGVSAIKLGDFYLCGEFGQVCDVLLV